MGYLEIANSAILWMACIPPVALVLVQAWIMSSKAWKTGIEMGIRKEQLMGAIRSSAVSSIGPSSAILSGMMALIAMAGGPIAWLRLSYIGAVTYEMNAFNFGLQASGVTPQTITGQAYTNAVWVMVVGSLGWIIAALVCVDKMDKVQGLLSKGDPKLMRIIGAAASAGGMSTLSAGYLVQLNPMSVASITGITMMALIQLVNQKLKIGWLSELSLTFCLIAGCVTASLYAAATAS